MMNESFLGIFDDDVSDAPPPASRQPSWAGLPSPGVLPASPGQGVQRQPSWADLPEGAPSIADAWDAVPLPSTLHKAPSGEVDVRETVMPAEILAMPEADLLTPLWAPDPPKRIRSTGKPLAEAAMSPRDPSDAGSEPTGEGKSSDGGEDEPPPQKPKKKPAPKKKKKKTTTKAKKPTKKKDEPPPPQEMKIGAVVTAPALAFGAAFASGAPEGKTYRGIVVDATDSDEAWVVRYDDDGLKFETATAFLTIVREEGGHHLRARRARALEERRRLERAKNEDKPWTPEETSELRSLVGELGASVETWPLIARRLKTGRPPVQVMSYFQSLPKLDLFAESSDDETPSKKKKRGRPPTPPESSDDDVPIAQLRTQKYAVGDRVEADWKSEGEYFPGRIASVKKDAYSIQYDDGDFERNVAVDRIRPLICVDEERIRSVVQRVPLEKREAVLREAIARAEASLPKVDQAASKGELPSFDGDEFASIVAKALDDGNDTPLCVRNALTKDSTLLTYMKDGPKQFLRRLRDLGHGSLSLLSFAGGSVSVDAALSLDVHKTPVALTPKLGGRLLDVLNGESTDKRRSNNVDRAPCLKGVPRFATALYGAYEDSEQFLVIQPGPSGDLRPHVDYLGSGVIYVLLQGKKKVSVWLPFLDDDRSNLSILASGHRRDVDVEDQLRGPRFDLDMRPGDALFIPPLFPHLVRNFEGGSIAYGVNIISQASGKMMEQVRDMSPYDRAVFACHYLPADYPDEEWAANYSEDATEKALSDCLQRVASVKPGLQETLRREAALKGREATVVTPTTPAVAREKPPAQPFAATRIGGVTSLADMAKVAAAVARAAPPPEPPKARLPPHYQKRRSRSPDDKKAKADDKKKKRSRSRGRRRRKSPSRSCSSSSSRSRSRSPKKRRAARSPSSSRSRSPKKRRRRRSRSRSRRKGRSRSPKRRKNRYDTALPSSSRSPPPRQRSRSRSRGRRRRRD
mmetsp:Transcript_15556/g.40942  ORF Transcript_15556/g.40942 Transcript_15556/m.40942 type:complete len:973 (-) Transcript_15556:15-2933(-)